MHYCAGYICVLRTFLMQQVAKANIVMLITYTHVGTVYNNHEISNYVYMCCVLIAFFLTLADGLLKMLYIILLHTQFRHPGAPKQTTTTSSGRSNYLYMTYLHV